MKHEPIERTMKSLNPILALIAALTVHAIPSVADDSPFAILGEQSLSQTELDAAFAQIPEAQRLAFIRDGGRVDQLVQNLLRVRQIAAEARASGFDTEPLVQARLNLEAEAELARAWMEQVMKNAPEADYAVLAEEYYLANPDQFMTGEARDVSHILIGTETRPEEEALSLVAEVEARLADDPAQFDALVMEYSEDPARENNLGRYPAMKRGEMVEPFEEAAFALGEVGQISEPVKTAYGYHVIRLNEISPPALLPFESVKEALMQQERDRHLARYRERYIAEHAAGEILIPDGAVEAMAKRHFGEDLELAPAFEER
jgi:peptidyl-prolyl cis-trans isomerase C